MTPPSIKVNIPGNPERFEVQKSEGWLIVGEVTIGGNSGVLAKGADGGSYAMLTDDGPMLLPQDRVIRAITGSNNTKMEGGKRRNIWMSESDYHLAKSVGDGNVSHGIRLALNAYSKAK